MVRAIAPTGMHVKAIPGDCPVTKDSHSRGRLVGGQVVDGILSICLIWPPGVQICSGWGRKASRNGTLAAAAADGWLKEPLVVSSQGSLGSGLTGVWWGALARQKEKWLFPSLSAELATLVSKNIKIRH